MLTNEELQISNESYTSKDFLSIYPELLDIIKKISPNWDPSLSNESDPGNVLLKALAFIGDKINYNTDKNTLENFLPSATQETSVRNLCEVNGYYPKYYQSAITTAKFRYDGTKLVAGDSLVFPAMNTVITDVDSKVSYSLMRPCTISRRKSPVEVPIIQGIFETLTVGGSEVIQLSDLDDNNRLYFPEPLIAQNGVFVYNKDSYEDGVTAADSSEDGSSWRCIDNLNLEEPASDNYVFKFGFDSIKEFI